MSQSKRFCMEIADSPEYRGLVSAMKSDQKEKALEYLFTINKKVKEFRAEVFKRIEGATQYRSIYDTRRDTQQFIDSFDREAQKYIPAWFEIYQEAKKMKKDSKIVLNP